MPSEIGGLGVPAERVVGVRITDGLGNQMFQYAAGLALSERLGARLVCDVSHYRRTRRRDRPLGLEQFGIALATERVPPFKPVRRLPVALGLLHRGFRKAQVMRQHEGFDPAFLELIAPAALAGYFQSWLYFSGHEASVRRVFDTERLSTARTARLEDEIRAAEHPVAVHVRRGDYLVDQQATGHFGVLGPDHYAAARQALEARVPAPTYFLFSDEPERARTELATWPDLRPVAGLSGPEDLRLMSLCRHFIIANSTFSWWGAWLGAAPDKLVVGPRRWFGPEYSLPVEIDDRLPPDWLRV